MRVFEALYGLYKAARVALAPARGGCGAFLYNQKLYTTEVLFRYIATGFEAKLKSQIAVFVFDFALAVLCALWAFRGTILELQTHVWPYATGISVRQGPVGSARGGLEAPIETPHGTKASSMASAK